jgi:drug/metabolite transporter (DMT)-like permease
MHLIQPDRALVLKAVMFVFLATLCFDTMTVLVRLMLVRYSAQELSAYRNILGVIPSLILMLWTRELKLKGTNLVIRQWPLALFRGVVVAFAQLFFYTSIGYLELATISALSQTVALFIVAMSVPLLGEKVGVWRWSAVLIGFAGAMMILRPGGDAFSFYALLPIAAAACYAFSMTTMRMFDYQASNALIYLYSSFASAAGAILLASLTTSFTPIHSWYDALTILTLSFSGGCGVLFLMLGYRMVPPGLLAPFSYFGLLRAFAAGWLFFDELPIQTLFPGVLLIVGAGAMIIWRQRGV